MVHQGREIAGAYSKLDALNAHIVRKVRPWTNVSGYISDTQSYASSNTPGCILQAFFVLSSCVLSVVLRRIGTNEVCTISKGRVLDHRV
jgi:hypothetical protein